MARGLCGVRGPPGIRKPGPVLDQAFHGPSAQLEVGRVQRRPRMVMTVLSYVKNRRGKV